MVAREVKLPKNKSFFIFGPRQTGKSTLIRADFKDALRYDLLKSREYLRLIEEPSLFSEEVLSASKQVSHVFVDEIQRIPLLLDEIHSLIETPGSPQFILTGSSARKLKRAQANLLAGRAWTFHLFPLTEKEIGEDFQLSKALDIGTLPQFYLEPNREDSVEFLKSYVETYLKEEIEAEALVRSTGTFLRFLFQAGNESGNIVNYSSISREIGSSHTTVKEYFQILEDTLLGNFLFPFMKSKRKRLSQHPKFYLFDTGVQRALTRKLELPIQPKTREYGSYFEHWVVNETIRIASYRRKDWDFSYFRTERGNELDLIIVTPNEKIYGIEIKASEQPRIGAGFQAFESVVKDFKRICVCTAPRPRKVGQTEILPWKHYLDWLRAL